MVGLVNRILSLASTGDRRLAATATAHGAALFYGFGNFCALAALPDQASVLHVNRMKGRPAAQAGSVTSDPARLHMAFDWRRLPRAVEPEQLTAMMTEMMSLGPIGFRGPAARIVPDHLTVMDGPIRTVQHITPGVRCRSNLLVADVLDRTGEDLLFVTSANRSSHRTGLVEAAHCEMEEIRRDFGNRTDAVMIGHDDEPANRRWYPRHEPCSTSIVSFHRDLREDDRPVLLLERHGSLGAADIRQIAARHGFRLAVTQSGQTRLPVRWPRFDRAVA
jgi:hypothetical protein